MKNEKEKKRSNPIVEAANKAIDLLKIRLNKMKTTRTEDRRLLEPSSGLKNPEKRHPRVYKLGGK